ncbi:hypothetical protein V6N12_018375 [Hibiscus sabdariffa]|uniref:Uncharacterized protein n=1 Tax=Hibiscus sabdariffa TaxID=183260 RepID=A0ABR2BQ77_9ROSI
MILLTISDAYDQENMDTDRGCNDPDLKQEAEKQFVYFLVSSKDTFLGSSDSKLAQVHKNQLNPHVFPFSFI